MYHNVTKPFATRPQPGYAPVKLYEIETGRLPTSVLCLPTSFFLIFKLPDSNYVNTNPQNNIALITGGSSGIGLAIAHELAKLKYNLLLVSNQEKELALSKEALEQQYGINCLLLEIDLATIDAPRQVFDYCLEQQLNIEILINNAGFLIIAEVLDTDPVILSKMIQLHLRTPTMLCRLFGEQMKTRNRGHILNVSSISAVMPYPIISLYGPTKTYLRYFTRALRTEMRPYGINVTCLMPGATVTGLYDLSKVNVGQLKLFGIFHTPQFVASRAVKGLMKRRAVVVPGLINKITIRLMPLIPTFIIAALNNRFSHTLKNTLKA
jgi:short-subunit dehydrogenase